MGESKGKREGEGMSGIDCVVEIIRSRVTQCLVKILKAQLWCLHIVSASDSKSKL